MNSLCLHKRYLNVTIFDAMHILVALSNEIVTVLRLILARAMLEYHLEFIFWSGRAWYVFMTLCDSY